MQDRPIVRAARTSMKPVSGLDGVGVDVEAYHARCPGPVRAQGEEPTATPNIEERLVLEISDQIAERLRRDSLPILVKVALDVSLPVLTEAERVRRWPDLPRRRWRVNG